MGAIADTSQAKMAVAKEVTFGTNPAAGAKAVRFTSDTLQQNTNTAASEEVAGDRNARETVRTSIGASGGINFEFSDNNFDDLLEGLMRSTFGNAFASVAEAAIVIENAAAGVFDLDDADVSDDAFANAVEGQWLRISGFATNGTIFARIVTKTSDSNVTCHGTREDGTAVTNEASSAVTIDGSHLKIGTDKPSYTLERQFPDVNTFDLFTGMVIVDANMAVTPDSFLTGALSFLGVKQQTFATSQIGAIAAAGTEKIVNAVDHIKGVMENAFTAESPLDVTEINWSFTNDGREQRAIGDLGPAGIGVGLASPTGTLVAFLQDRTLVERYLNFTASKIAYRTKDAAGNVMIWTWPRIKFTDGRDPVGGNASDGLVELDWAAEKEDGVSNAAMTIDRFSAL